MINKLFGGVTTSFVTGACRSQKRTCSADRCEDGSRVLRRIVTGTGSNTSALSVERKGDGKQKSDAEK